MGYKPKKQSSFAENPSGVAKLIKRPNRKIGVMFRPDNKNEFAGKKYEVDKWDANLKPQLLFDNEWYIKLNSNGKEIFSISPLRGQFTVKVSEFIKQEGQPASPKYMAHWQYPEHVFFVLLEILGGDEACIGMNLMLMLPYRFAEDEETPGQVAFTKFSEKSNTMKLVEFLELSGVLRDDGWELKWSDNLLPDIERIAVRENRQFGVVVKDGFVDYMYATEQGSSRSQETSSEDAPWDVEEPVEEETSQEDLDWN